MLPLIRLALRLCRPGLPGSGPPGEGAWTRQLRQRRDRASLADLDDRLLRDMGLTRQVTAAGLDFAPLSPADPGGDGRPATSPHDCRSPDDRRIVAVSPHRHGAIDWP
ncbi:hypothetical protein VQ02_19710 [Methylobacterium variabile]|jgi:hypothetical protein|uniref:YjiS-like domain-containing protein n=1 Tax=Methylobacterium variabile TaxID=298794 RepID=A0A0J6V592_9HYPH|nr:DUF1127 domain-containing protein [Methylobacterium variabile]KMO34046.1 hypothetical protein VQ02_19710 [Methylobacterium variabile]